MESTTKGLAVAAGALLLVAAILASAGPAGYGFMALLGAGILGCAALVSHDARRGALATAMWSAGASAYLLSHKMAAEAGPSICNVNQVINCDLVNASAASEMFGLPITLFGLAFYIGLALAAALAGPLREGAGRAEDARFDQVNALFGIVNVAYSIYLAWQSESIGAVCVVCVSMYLGNALLLASGLIALRRQRVRLLDQAGGLVMSAPSATIAGVFLVVTLIGSSAWATRSHGPVLALTPTPAPTPTSSTGGTAPAPPAPQEEPDVSAIYHLPRGVVTTSGDEPTLGSKDPKYILLEWADFACPHCAHAFGEVHQLIAENPDLQLRFRVFPLTGNCNPALEHENGPERCFAALAAFCAGKQGKFFEVAGKLFQNQPNYYHGSQYQVTSDDLTAVAEEAGVDLTAWNSCMADPAMLQRIQADAVAGAQTGLEGTPSFFLKGTHGEQWIEVAAGPDGVSQMLAAARSGAQLPPAPPAPPAGM
jgi:protein-disulfide isomerase/uncharacterized membrane protein